MVMGRGRSGRGLGAAHSGDEGGGRRTDLDAGEIHPTRYVWSQDVWGYQQEAVDILMPLYHLRNRSVDQMDPLCEVPDLIWSQIGAKVDL